MSLQGPSAAAGGGAHDRTAGRQRRARLGALAALAVTNVCDVGFLLFDPRNSVLEPWLAALFLAGGAGFAAALFFVLQLRASGFVLGAILAPPSALVVAFDNLNASASGPTPAVFALNAVFFVAQPVVAAASVYWLRLRAP